MENNLSIVSKKNVTEAKLSIAAVLTGFPKLKALSLNMQHLSVHSFMLFYPPVFWRSPSAQVTMG